MSAILSLPKLPYDGFPLRPHRNGQWFRSCWNAHSKKSEQFYFGSWTEDPKGERAIKDPVTGWLARRDGIKAGIDNVRVQVATGDLTLGELMARFLSFKRSKVTSGELSLIERIEVVHTPKHGSWMNMAETELSALSRQCIEGRIADVPTLKRLVRAWEKDRSHRMIKIDWQFTTADARIKLRRLYPKLSG